MLLQKVSITEEKCELRYFNCPTCLRHKFLYKRISADGYPNSKKTFGNEGDDVPGKGHENGGGGDETLI
jgi:hypothetical protein